MSTRKHATIDLSWSIVFFTSYNENKHLGNGEKPDEHKTESAMGSNPRMINYNRHKKLEKEKLCKTKE